MTRPQVRPLMLHRLEPGDEADLVALRRAAAARRGPRFPPDEGATPRVDHGTLLACGGGDLPPVVWQRFVELAGGPDAPIVVLPIATPDPDDPAPKGVDALRALGCRDLTVLPQRTRSEVESAEFAHALRRARGVWFAGGRQWKYVDAYEGTAAVEHFRGVLQRGGVIGGTSAGTAIQAEYLVRGNPLGNKQIIAEGYEQGLGFLPGAALDIHVSQRGRVPEMLQVLRLYPHLLGISLDEGIAAEIQGSVLRLWGRGEAFITESNRGAPIVLHPGDRFDLAKRRRLP